MRMGASPKYARLNGRHKQQKKTEAGVFRQPTDPVEVQILFAKNMAGLVS